VAGALVLAAGAVVLAGRAAPGPRPRPVPTATPTVPPAAYPVFDVGTDGTRVALLTGCPTGACTRQVRVFARGRWTSDPLPEAVYPGRLRVGPGYVAVLDDSGGYVSRGGAYVRSDLVGPAVAAAPDLPVEADRGRVGVRDPRFRPLATQPLPPSLLASAVRYGTELWAAGRAGDRLVAARSADRGRHWSVTPVATLPATDVPVIQLLPGGDRLWLLAAGPDGTGRSRPVLVRALTPAGWVPVDPGPGGYADALASPAGLLVVDGNSAGRWLAPGAPPRPLAAAPLGLVPADLHPGPDGTLVAVSTDRRHVLLTGDGGGGWDVVPLPT
jgi:hypothetical protein